MHFIKHNTPKFAISLFSSLTMALISTPVLFSQNLEIPDAPSFMADPALTPIWKEGTNYKVGDQVHYPDEKGPVYKCLMAHAANQQWIPPLASSSSIWEFVGMVEPTVKFPVKGELDEIHIEFFKTIEDAANINGKLIIRNPNSKYVYNGTCFVIDNIQAITSSKITKCDMSGTKIKTVVNGDNVKFYLDWASVFPYDKKIIIDITLQKSGDKPLFQEFKPRYLRGDITYPDYGDLPTSWTKAKADLSVKDLIVDETKYYKSAVGPVKDKFIIYNPEIGTQLLMNQTLAVNYIINGTGKNGKVRVHVIAKYAGLGLAYVYEVYKINPNFMMALSTKENWGFGLVPEGEGGAGIPIVVDGKTYYWWMHPTTEDGPYQQETGNFQGCQWYFPDILAPTAMHDDFTKTTLDINDPTWISAGISSGLSLSVSREHICGIYEADDPITFYTKCADPWAEFGCLAYSYNRGYKAFTGIGFFKEATKSMKDSIKDLKMIGFADYVPTLRAILDTLNNDTTMIFDQKVAWSDMEIFFKKLRMFFKNGIPDDTEWNAMVADVKRAFDVLKTHWGGDTISLRYDMVTLIRVAKKYLPKPLVTRPTGQYWYSDIMTTKPKPKTVEDWD